jgi:hypothetical protein
MPRTDIYIKVEIDHERAEPPAVLAEEIRRRVEKLYGVRKAEVQSIHPRGED